MAAYSRNSPNSRRGVDWADLGLQFAGFIAVFVLLTFVNWPLLPKLLLAFALAMVMGVVIHRLRWIRRRQQRQQQPQQIKVIKVETVADPEDPSEPPRW
ncbi:hypothetical protein ODZ83_01500 [Acaricomes phytoseiuli]|uniref:hypothetical protein n=1 Tax=Acaricomes phytoseiuli TaxID=291968 RepID=UPI0003A2ADF3|nr:hypothetical protein [Acaricomes phytoseiuli]MCW1248880.1 hypothetical protein [Acaricomes phytoseiuli]